MFNTQDALKSERDFNASIIYQKFNPLRSLRFINAIQKLERIPVNLQYLHT